MERRRDTQTVDVTVFQSYQIKQIYSVDVCGSAVALKHSRLLVHLFLSIFMAFPTLSSQQETNRKILEDLQIKKQLLQKGVSPVVVTGISGVNPVTTPSPVPQMSQPVIPPPSTEFNQTLGARGVPFNISNAPTFGFFVPQDSFYGNTFLPVLPRLDPPAPSVPQK